MRILGRLLLVLATALAVVLLIAAIRPVVPASPCPADPLLNAGFESGALALVVLAVLLGRRRILRTS